MTKKTVKIKKYIDINEEFIAHADISPGMLVEMRSDGKAQPHGTEGGHAVPAFALEDELQGKTVRDKIAAGQLVQVWYANTGEQVLARLKEGQNVVVGDKLVSAGGGLLKKAGSGDTEYVAEALEAKDLSDSEAVAEFIQVRIV